MLLILNLLGGCKYKIYNMTSYHVVNFVFTPTQIIQNLQHDAFSKIIYMYKVFTRACAGIRLV